ncbi:ester cyclase [Paenibacillus sp. CECT 9249]|nr:ester cyclase [Paenibacillus sp. CECT 9249]
MTVEAGPIAEDPCVTARWKFTGTITGRCRERRQKRGKRYFSY